MTILDKMILTGRLADFVREFVTIRNEEMDEQTKWEYWLHKVFDKSFKEFLEQTERAAEETTESVSKEELTETVFASTSILNSFCPS